MRSTIARFALRSACGLVAMLVGGAEAESLAQTSGGLATTTPTVTATVTPGVSSAPVVRSDTRAERPAEKKTRHLTGVRPQGSLHRYYQEQSRAQAARGSDAPSSRRVVGLEMDANWSTSVSNPFTDESRASVVAPPDAKDVQALDPDSYLDGLEMSVVAPPPASL